jgi:hypothetical protein
VLTKEYIRRLSGSRTYNKGIEVYNEGKVVPFSAEENQATDREKIWEAEALQGKKYWN